MQKSGDSFHPHFFILHPSFIIIMGNSTSSSKATTEPRKVGIASHPYQQRHPYNLDDDDEASIYTENYEEHYNDELLEPRQLKDMFSNEGRDSSKTRKCRQKQGSRRAGEVFEPIIRNYNHRLSSSQKNYDNLGRYDEDHDQIESFHGKQASKRTILKALQQKMTAQSDLGHRNILTKSSTDSDESNGSALSFREVMQLSATNDNTVKGDNFHTYGKQLSTIMDVSEYSNTIFDDTVNEESYILSEHEKTCFSSDQKLNESVESNTSEQDFIDHDLTDYTDRMISFLDKNHASYNQDVEKIADIKTPNQNLGNLFADMTLDQSSKYIVMDDALTDKEQDDDQDLDETTNGTWDEFDDSSSKLFEKSPKNNNNNVHQTLNHRKACDLSDQNESNGKNDDDQSTTCDEELSSIETSVMESNSLTMSEITGTKMSRKEDVNEMRPATPYQEYISKMETRDPSPVPMFRSLKAPTTSKHANLLPSFSNNDDSCDSSTHSKKREISVLAQKIANDVKKCNIKNIGPEIGTYIEVDDDMTQVSAITTAPVLDACAVIKNHSKPAFSKQAISNAAFLFSYESVPLQRRTLCPSIIDVQRLSLLNIDPINRELTNHSLPVNHFNRGDLINSNEAPVDMVRRLSRESLNGRTWTKEISSSAVVIKRSNGYVQNNSQGSIFSIPEEKSPVKLDVMGNENNGSKYMNLTKADQHSDQSTTPNKNISSVKLKEEYDIISEALDDDTLPPDFQKRYSAITPMKTKSPYIRFKKALRMFGGEINKNDSSQDLKPTLEKKSDADSTHDTLSSVGSNTNDDNATHSPGLSVKSSIISITDSSVNDVFADLLNCSSPESVNCNMYLPQQLQSAMKKPNHVRENSTNRVSWVVASSSDASDIFRNRESSKNTTSPMVDSSVADSASAISMTPPPPVASSSRTFRSVVNPRMMFQSSQVQSKVNIAENDENSSKSSYCSYSPLQLHPENKTIEKTVPNSRSALCLSPLQKTPSQSRKWRSNTEHYVNGNDKGGKKRQKSLTKRTPFANLRNANIV